MQEKIVRCPNCGATMKVRNSKNEIDKRFSCLKCKAPLRVKFPPVSTQESPETKPAQAVNSDETIDMLSKVIVGGVGGYIIAQDNNDDDNNIPSLDDSGSVESDPAIDPIFPTAYMDDVAPGMPDYMSDADVSMLI